MADCDPGCSNISIMQLFHELKQKFPAIPDRVVSECIKQNAHDKKICEAILRQENQGYLLHSYPVALKMSSEPSHLPEQSVVPSCNSNITKNNNNNNNKTSVESLSTNVETSSAGDSLSVVTYHSGDRHAVSVNYTTSPSNRVRSAVQLSPSPHFLCPPPQQARSYTSVNLTLRPPSSEPQPPIDIHSAGSSLTYSTCSFDPRQGYQSQLQIRIGPGGMGSVSALRTNVPTLHTSSPQIRAMDQQEQQQQQQLYSEALLCQQMERKNKLQQELRKEKENLRAMQREVQEMRKDLEQRQRRKQTMSLPVVSAVLQRVQELRIEIQRLQEECKKMTQEVDQKLDSRVPLGETDEEFYKNIYTGQRGYVISPPPRSAPPRPDTGPGRGGGGDSTEGPHWTCTQCTFQNHPLLDKCETCEMPRILLGSTSCYCHPAKKIPPLPVKCELTNTD